MKKQIMIVALMVASVIAIAGFASTAMAVDPSAPEAWIQVSGNGNTWQVALKEDTPISEITNIKAEFWIFNSDTNEDVFYPIEARSVVINANKIQLVFDKSVLPTTEVDGSLITIEFAIHDDIPISGPGFAWGRTR